MRQHIVTLSALLIFQPAQRDWLKNNVYAALRTEHAGMGFVVGAILPRLWCVHEVGVTEGTEMGRQFAVVLYVVAMVAIIVGVDVVFFRNHIWGRLAVNLGIVLVFGAFYFRFLSPP